MIMRLISKYAVYVGFVRYGHIGTVHEWRCPNKKCGINVSDTYKYCPYCGQKLKFNEGEKDE